MSSEGLNDLQIQLTWMPCITFLWHSLDRSPIWPTMFLHVRGLEGCKHH